MTLVGGRNPCSRGDQVVLRDVRALVPAAKAPAPPLVWINRGNVYPRRFDELLAALPEAVVVLDVGGGDRRHDDGRVLNMEYLPFQAVDFRGDGQCLPLASNSVDLILSQAVLEHVPHPAGQVDEMFRVLKPGGRIYVEIAFMQPLHAVPYHFFNVTPHGMSLLFERFEVLDQGAFGGLADTVAWFFRLLDAERRIGTSAAHEVIDSLSRLDATMSAGDLAQLASAVYVEARKPV
jgi:SAM-dependent methyltransferase